jgi:cell division protein FtsW
MVKKFIPDVHTDFIFSAIAEEFGAITCIAILLLFLYFVARIVRRALDEKDLFVYLSLCGLMVQFTLQVIVNTGVSLSILPTKGMTLPFISYGGSSLIATSICFGLILALTKKRYHRDVDYGNIKNI